jgi:hypothetical protein
MIAQGAARAGAAACEPEIEIILWIFLRRSNGQVFTRNAKMSYFDAIPKRTFKCELQFVILTVWVDKNKVEHTGNDPQSNQEPQNFKE